MVRKIALGPLGAVMLGLALLLLASCVSMDFTRPSDYIGPVREAEVRPPAPPPALPPEAAPAEPPPAEAPEAAAPQPIEFGVQEAIVMAMENNRALSVERLRPPIRRTFEQEERAAFDPVLTAGAGRERTREPDTPPDGPSNLVTKAITTDAAVSEFLPTGTTLSVGASTEVLDGSLYDDRIASSRVGLSVTQALLRGASIQANLANLRQARLDTLASEYELRGFAEALAAGAEDAYWDYALALRQIDIVTDSLALAERQQADTQERIAVGQLAEIELAAAQSEVALRTEGLINTRSALATAKLILLRLINAGPAGSGGSRWDRDITLLEEPIVPEAALDSVQAEVALALKMRPDLNQARLDLERNELELVKTRNGLLPRMDLFIALGKSGYAASFGDSVGRLGGPGYDVLAGVNFEYPPLNRGARARNEQALLTRQQAAEAVANLAQLVELDVRSAYIEVNRAREQVTATAATRKSQEETLRAETEKFQVGKSTTFLVARAQRDLLVGQIAEVQAVINYRKALVDLHRQEGSLLARQGIEAPGGAPPVLPRTRK